MKKITKNPVKYAILTLRETDPKTNKKITRGKIVSKCYLLETHERVFPDGEVYTNYIVNFPYTDIATYEQTMFSVRPSIGEPNFDTEEKVENVYDTYDEAQEDLKRQNHNMERMLLIKAQLSGTDWKNKYVSAMKTLKKAEAVCSLYELRVLDATEEMKLEEKGKVNIKVD